MTVVCLDNNTSKHGCSQRVHFSFKSVPGRKVALAGSFNDWDPDSAPMADTKGVGNYGCSVTLPPGNSEYKFVVDGEWILDDDNPEFASNDFGTLNSVVKVK